MEATNDTFFLEIDGAIDAAQDDGKTLAKFAQLIKKYARLHEWDNPNLIQNTETALLHIAEKDNGKNDDYILVATATVVGFWVTITNDAELLELTPALRREVMEEEYFRTLTESAEWILLKQGPRWLWWWHNEDRQYYDLEEAKVLIDTLINRYYPKK